MSRIIVTVNKDSSGSAVLKKVDFLTKLTAVQLFSAIKRDLPVIDLDMKDFTVENISKIYQYLRNLFEDEAIDFRIYNVPTHEDFEKLNDSERSIRQINPKILYNIFQTYKDLLEKEY